MTDWQTMRKRARLAEEIIPVCLAGDLLAEHQLLEQQLDQADENRTDSLAGDGLGELRDKLRDVEAEIRENTYHFRLRAMPHLAWERFINDRPPRRDESGEIVEDDQGAGYNVEAVYNDVVRPSLVDPDVSNEVTWAEVLESLTDAQYQEFAQTALRLNRGRISIPKSLAASRTSQNSGGA